MYPTAPGTIHGRSNSLNASMRSNPEQQQLADLLLQVQSDFKQIKDTLAQSQTLEGKEKLLSIQSVIEKAESNLRSKAEYVLQYTLSEPPRIAATAQQTFDDSYLINSSPVSDTFVRSRRPRASSGSIGERMKAQRRMDLIAQPEKFGRASREVLEEEFGIPVPRDDGSVLRKSLVQSQLEAKKRIVKGPNCKPNQILPRENRINPAAPGPPITAKDLEKGIMNLVDRGIVPPHMDLTNVFYKAPSPIVTEPVVLHNHTEQFQKRLIHTTTEFGFDITNIKLDVLPKVLEPSTNNNSNNNNNNSIKIPQPILSVTPVAAPPPPKPQIDEVFKEMEEEELKAKTIEVDQARSYTDLMDAFSLHQFIIRKGKVLDSTPEFISYQRTYKSQWGPITTIIHQLEKLLAEFNVPLAFVDGKKVAELARSDLDLPTNEQLLQCLANYNEVLPMVNLPGQKYKGSNKEHKAATTIQKTFKMYRQRKRFKVQLLRRRAAITIQRQWSVYVQHNQTKELLKQQFNDLEIMWRMKMQEFKQNWPEIKKNKRVIIHIPSLTYEEFVRRSIPQFACYQNSQLARLCDTMDPNVEVLYISPFPIDEEAVNYYTKILQIGGVYNPEQRFKIIYPDSYDYYAERTSLTNQLLYSARTLKRIMSHIRGKEAYIVPGVVGHDELKLALKLQLPILGADPAIAQAYSSKSGNKRLFAAAEVSTPPAAYDLYEENEIYLHLSRLVVDYPEYQRWVIKIDNEYGGRGIAYLDTNKIRCLNEREREKLLFDLQKVDQANTFKNVLRERVYFDIKESAAKKIKIVRTEIYPTWKDYLVNFCKSGGVIEACPNNIVGSPNVNIFIEPDGTVTVLSSQEQVFGAPFCCIGASFPQTSVPFAALREAALTIGRICYAKKIMGHVTVDFVAFTKDDQIRIWAVDLKLNLTDNSLFHQLFDFVLGGRLNTKTGEYSMRASSVNSSGGSVGSPMPELQRSESPSSLPKSLLKRAYVYSGLIRHPDLKFVRHGPFFQLCRQKGISFDIQNKVGTVFHMVDSLLRGMIGVLCIGHTLPEAVRTLSEVMDFIVQEISKQAISSSGGSSPSDASGTPTLSSTALALEASDSDTNLDLVMNATRILVQQTLSTSASPTSSLDSTFTSHSGGGGSRGGGGIAFATAVAGRRRGLADSSLNSSTSSIKMTALYNNRRDHQPPLSEKESRLQEITNRHLRGVQQQQQQQEKPNNGTTATATSSNSGSTRPYSASSSSTSSSGFSAYSSFAYSRR